VHAQHVGAHVRQHHGSERPRAEACDLQDADARQRSLAPHRAATTPCRASSETRCAVRPSHEASTCAVSSPSPCTFSRTSGFSPSGARGRLVVLLWPAPPLEAPRLLRSAKGGSAIASSIFL